MTHDQRRVWLIQALLDEDPRYREIRIPEGEQDQRDLLRALMNVRMPNPVSREFLEIQDGYLREERDRAGVTEAERLPALRCDRRLVLWRGDITTLCADAIVNAANSALLGCFRPLHSCIDNLIHTRSGVQLRLRCADIMRRQGFEEPAGQAKITPGFNLPCRYILHTVGPIISGRVTQRDRELLSSCYTSCLRLAAEYGCRSVAFCCISTGEFHFPQDQAAEIAVGAVRAFLETGAAVERVIFDVFKDEDLRIYRALLGENLA